MHDSVLQFEKKYNNSNNVHRKHRREFFCKHMELSSLPCPKKLSIIMVLLFVRKHIFGHKQHKHTQNSKIIQ